MSALSFVLKWNFCSNKLQRVKPLVQYLVFSQTFSVDQQDKCYRTLLVWTRTSLWGNMTQTCIKIWPLNNWSNLTTTKQYMMWANNLHSRWTDFTRLSHKPDLGHAVLVQQQDKTINTHEDSQLVWGSASVNTTTNPPQSTHNQSGSAESQQGLMIVYRSASTQINHMTQPQHATVRRHKLGQCSRPETDQFLKPTVITRIHMFSQIIFISCNITFNDYVVVHTTSSTSVVNVLLNSLFSADV